MSTDYPPLIPCNEISALDYQTIIERLSKHSPFIKNKELSSALGGVISHISAGAVQFGLTNAQCFMNESIDRTPFSALATGIALAESYAVNHAHPVNIKFTPSLGRWDLIMWMSCGAFLRRLQIEEIVLRTKESFFSGMLAALNSARLNVNGKYIQFMPPIVVSINHYTQGTLMDDIGFVYIDNNTRFEHEFSFHLDWISEMPATCIGSDVVIKGLKFALATNTHGHDAEYKRKIKHGFLFFPFLETDINLRDAHENLLPPRSIHNLQFTKIANIAIGLDDPSQPKEIDGFKVVKHTDREYLQESEKAGEIGLKCYLNTNDSKQLEHFVHYANITKASVVGLNGRLHATLSMAAIFAMIRADSYHSSALPITEVDGTWAGNMLISAKEQLQSELDTRSKRTPPPPLPSAVQNTQLFNLSDELKLLKPPAAKTVAPTASATSDATSSLIKSLEQSHNIAQRSANVLQPAVGTVIAPIGTAMYSTPGVVQPQFAPQQTYTTPTFQGTSYINPYSPPVINPVQYTQPQQTFNPQVQRTYQSRPQPAYQGVHSYEGSAASTIDTNGETLQDIQEDYIDGYKRHQFAASLESQLLENPNSEYITRAARALKSSSKNRNSKNETTHAVKQFVHDGDTTQVRRDTSAALNRANAEITVKDKFWRNKFDGPADIYEFSVSNGMFGTAENPRSHEGLFPINEPETTTAFRVYTGPGVTEFHMEKKKCYYFPSLPFAMNNPSYDPESYTPACFDGPSNVYEKVVSHSLLNLLSTPVTDWILWPDKMLVSLLTNIQGFQFKIEQGIALVWADATGKINSIRKQIGETIWDIDPTKRTLVTRKGSNECGYETYATMPTGKVDDLRKTKEFFKHPRAHVMTYVDIWALPPVGFSASKAARTPFIQYRTALHMKNAALDTTQTTTTMLGDYAKRLATRNYRNMLIGRTDDQAVKDGLQPGYVRRVGAKITAIQSAEARKMNRKSVQHRWR